MNPNYSQILSGLSGDAKEAMARTFMLAVSRNG